MKNPILLAGHTLNPGAVLWPTSMGIKRMADGLSTASMTLPHGGPAVQLGNWLLVSTPQDEEMVMRVTSVKTDQDGTLAMTAEHIFGALKDSVTGTKINEDQADISAADALSALLAKQKEPIWTLDRCEFEDKMPWSFANASIYNDLTTLTDSLEDSQWVFDMGAIPFRLSLTRRPTTPTCEMRLNRNISTASITVDSTGMYTRAYPVGMDELSIEGANGGVPYIERNVGQYGIIEETITNSAIDNETALLAWAQAQLARNCVPAVTVSITGREMSKRTGATLDRLTVGTVCRVALPEEGLTVEERITSLEWKDAMADEESVTVTLGNEHRTVQGIMRKIQAEVAEVKRGSGGSGAKLEEGNKNLWTKIDQTDAYILLEAGRLDERIDGNTLNLAQLNITADQIQSVVAKYNYDTFGDLLEGYYSEITQNADNILLKVSKTDYNGKTIASLINIGTESILIQSNRIDLSGYVTASQLSAEIATFQKNFSANASIMILELGTLRYRGHEVSLKTQSVVTSVSGRASGEIAVRDAEGKIAGTALTGYRVSYNTEEISYLAYD